MKVLASVMVVFAAVLALTQHFWSELEDTNSVLVAELLDSVPSPELEEAYWVNKANEEFQIAELLASWRGEDAEESEEVWEWGYPEHAEHLTCSEFEIRHSKPSQLVPGHEITWGEHRCPRCNTTAPGGEWPNGKHVVCPKCHLNLICWGNGLYIWEDEGE